MLPKEDYAKSIKTLNSLPAFDVSQPLKARVLYYSVNVKDVNYNRLTTKQHSHFFYEMHIPVDTDASRRFTPRSPSLNTG